MWLSERKKTAKTEEVRLGSATIGGAESAVYVDAEKRGVPVYAPGGYVWMPKAGDKVVVFKCGADGTYIAGKMQAEPPENMKNGEVFITSEGGAALWLKNDGSAVICGDVKISGRVDIDGSLFLNGIEVI